MTKAVFWGIILFGSAYLFAQERTLEQIQEDIRRIEAEIRQKESLEQSTLEKMENLDREIGLRKELLARLNKEQKENSRTLAQINRDLKTTEDAFERRKKRVSERMIKLYKNGRMNDWEILLSLDSFDKFMVWVKYQKIILDADRRDIEILKQQHEAILDKREKQRAASLKQERLIKNEITAAEKLESQKEEQQVLLASVRQDKSALDQQKRNQIAAMDKIRSMLSEKTTATAVPERQKSIQFASQRGRLPWPVHGKLVSAFGSDFAPEAWLVGKSDWIEIEGPDNAEVSAIEDGKVIAVEWIRGADNVVILDHGDGYDSVYGYLQTAFIEPGMSIKKGDVLGRLGDSSTFHGSRLRFSLYLNRTAVNPAEWLGKN